jgi:hypothetical protein
MPFGFDRSKATVFELRPLEACAPPTWGQIYLGTPSWLLIFLDAARSYRSGIIDGGRAMFGFGKEEKLREIDQRFGNILAMLGSGGDARASDGIEGVRDALILAKKMEFKGLSDEQTSNYLMIESSKSTHDTSGWSLGFILVSLGYSARSIGGAKARQLSGSIMAFAAKTAAKASKTGGTLQSSQDRSEPVPQISEALKNKESSEKSVELMVHMAEVLTTILNTFGLYTEVQSSMRPSMVGYIWGWCDACC